MKTMLRLMKERESVNVVNDQLDSPTYAADLARAILTIATSNLGGKEGIYHYSNDGLISWFDFAVAIKEFSASNCTVNPIPTSAYPTPAKRPAYSVFDKTKIDRTFSILIVNWKSSLNSFFRQLDK